MRNIEMVDLRTQYAKIKQDVDQALQRVIDTSAFINGEPVKSFSKNLAEYLNVNHVIPCANGTDALQIALMAMDLEQGDEIITSPFTFVATAEVIALLNLIPRFVDIDPDTFNIDVDKIENVISKRSKCIIPVHLFGQAAHLEPMMQIAQKHNLKIIEDNAQATGARYIFSDGRRKRLGAIGDIGCTSFYPTKNLGGYGDGGAISTNSDQYARKLYLITNHGSDRKYYYDEIGVNSRLDSFQAAVLDIKLRYLDEYNKARQKAAEFYDANLGDIQEIQIPVRAQYSTHVFHQYTIKAERRDALKDFLASHGIPSMVYYPVPLHVSKAYGKYGYKNGDFPVAEKVAQQVLSLPMHSELEEEQLEFITKNIKSFYKK